MGNWSIIKHWAELALALAVWHLFGTCENFHDAVEVIRDADDVTRLGIVTATTIAANGFCGIVKALACWLRLAEARRLPRLLRRLWASRARRHQRPADPARHAETPE